MMSVLEEMKRMASALDISVAQLAISWALSNDAISSTLVGSRTITKLEANVAIVEYNLPSNIKEELNKLSNPILKKLGTNPDYYENRGNSRIH